MNKLEEINKKIKEFEEEKNKIVEEERKRLADEKEVRWSQVQDAYKTYATLRDEYYKDYNEDKVVDIFSSVFGI